MNRKLTGFNHRRLLANLMRDPKALAGLAELGLDRAFVEERNLGIREPHRRGDGAVVSGVLAYPLADEDGRWRWGCVTLAGVTANPDHPVAWNAGPARSVPEGDAGTLLVVGSPLVALQVGVSARRRGLALAAVASSRPEVLPAEWSRASFWAKWDRVVLCDGVPPHLRDAIGSAARRPLHHAPGAATSGDPDLPPAARLDAWVDALAGAATPLVVTPLRAVLAETADPGDYAAAVTTLHGGFSGGHLYYPVTVERRRAGAGASGRLLHSYETVVVRSDGSLLEATTLPAPAGTPTGQRVHALTDGVRIPSPPQPSAHSTWSLASIQRFVAARSAGLDPCDRPPDEVLSDVRATISSRVALPSADDEWVVAVFVVLTHLHRVFEALPVLLLEGPRGSGKTELAAVVGSLSFNAVMMGQGSAAALVRLARECGGLIALDDAEGLSSLGTGFGELSQALKTGYRRASSRKPVTMPSGRIESFDFFGPRLVTCTRGVDPVLGSRCIRVPTAPGAPSRAAPEVEPDDLRDDLHVLAMARAAEVAEVHRPLADAGVDRADEIWAPMLAIARVLGSLEARQAIDRARAAHGSALRAAA